MFRWLSILSIEYYRS